MTKIIGAFCCSTILLGVLLHAGAAGAVAPTATRTWVSGAGNDSNPCTRALPCASFQHAYSVTSAGGEIDVLDGGDFGPLTIQHALTIANDGAGTAAISVGSNSEIAIGVQSSDAVVLRGLALNGFNFGSTTGVFFYTGGSLLIDHCTIQNLPQAGLWIQSLSGANISIKDTVFANDGNSNGAAIDITSEAPATGALLIHMERVQILQAAGNAIRADGTQGPLSIDVELRDVTVDGASGGSGIVAVSPTSGGPTVRIMADNVTSSHNAGYGFRAVGGTATVYLSRSVSEDNGVGVGVSSGGVIYSYGDNRFASNTGGDGATPTSIGLK